MLNCTKSYIKHSIYSKRYAHSAGPGEFAVDKRVSKLPTHQNDLHPCAWQCMHHSR